MKDLCLPLNEEVNSILMWYFISGWVLSIVAIILWFKSASRPGSYTPDVDDEQNENL